MAYIEEVLPEDEATKRAIATVRLSLNGRGYVPLDSHDFNIVVKLVRKLQEAFLLMEKRYWASRTDVSILERENAKLKSQIAKLNEALGVVT